MSSRDIENLKKRLVDVSRSIKILKDQGSESRSDLEKNLKLKTDLQHKINQLEKQRWFEQRESINWDE